MSNRHIAESGSRGWRKAAAVAGIIFFTLPGTAVAANAASPAGHAPTPPASASARAPAGARQSTSGHRRGKVQAVGAGTRISLLRDAWAHHLPRIYTTPDRVFTAHPGENLAALCRISGDVYQGNVFWDLVIDRSQGNAIGYISEADIAGATPLPACGSS